MTCATPNPTVETLKKIFLIGLGATVLTGEKIKEMVTELVNKGELSHDDAKNFGEELMQRAVKEKEQFESKIKDSVDGYLKKAVDGLGLVTKADFEALKTELGPKE
jgi:polyhydroxyalkanoate synthesis regulator phasin